MESGAGGDHAAAFAADVDHRPKLASGVAEADTRGSGEVQVSTAGGSGHRVGLGKGVPGLVGHGSEDVCAGCDVPVQPPFQRPGAVLVGLGQVEVDHDQAGWSAGDAGVGWIGDVPSAVLRGYRYRVSAEQTASLAANRASDRLGRSPVAAFAAGAAVGVLGGMIGLGGAEFRLPLLIGLFGFAALQAVILNKVMSLAVVLTALPARLIALPATALASHWLVAVNLLAGSLAGAWVGASWATRMRTATLHRVLAGLLLLMAAALIWTHLDSSQPSASLSGPALAVVGLVAGFGIGVVAAVMGVAGGELLIPTIVLLYGLDIKLAGSLSLAVALPTILVAFARYSRDQAFSVLRGNGTFVAAMTAGSITGTVLGALLLGIVPNLVLIPVLALILLVSAVKLWRH